MEKKPRKDADAKVANDVRKQLFIILHLVASDAQKQISYFSHQPVVITDEMALDFDNWFLVTKAYWFLSREEERSMARLKNFLDRMSKEPEDSFWTNEALFTDKRWEEVRKLAKEAIDILVRNSNTSS